ncbi:MAG: 2-polyprenylphenol 6-hydroxylase [Hyphomicrobiaceae bacterium]|nr:2-polyprenylphenol 6-hydroxylase [Hyphomicrobiaceae bacterium]
MGLMAYFRLIRAGFVLAREGALSLVDAKGLPPGPRFLLGLARLVERRDVRRTGRVARLQQALVRLGPTYVKFGQSLATRPDIVGPEIAEDLSGLQDSLPPFDQGHLPELLHEALGARADDLFEISAPVAAASIAQVHQARLRRADGGTDIVAVKVLRPGIEDRFARDIESYYAGARIGEALVPKLRRLRPIAVVETLDRLARLELDLRFEAAAISEYAESLTEEQNFACPEVSWDHTGKRVLTTSWLDGIPVRDLGALDKAGVDRKALGARILLGFLKQAIGTGFFHADMHPGNMFVEPQTGRVLMVDFGIMGRISMRERRFLAEVLYGFISRDYGRIARLHIDIGYVPATENADDFASALRTVGEPMHGRSARDISMARVLGQLFAITELFNMQTRPELILLQKNMVLAEGVARMVDPDLDIWDVAKPFVSQWVRDQAGPAGKIAELREHGERAITALGKLPALVGKAETVLDAHAAEFARHRNGGPHLPMGWTLGLVLVVALGAFLLGRLF